MDWSVLGDNDIDDVRWLCSLTESELDLLMGLKTMVNMRAKQIGHENLAKKFDLKMLRTLSVNDLEAVRSGVYPSHETMATNINFRKPNSFIFMEHLNGLVKDTPAASDFNSNLLKQNLSGSFSSMTIEDLYPYICSDKKKRIADMFLNDMPPSRKKKTSRQDSTS